MYRWIRRIFGLSVVGYIAFGIYQEHRAGYWSLPDIPEGAYIASFKPSFRAIILDAKVESDHYSDYPDYARRLSWANPSRKYIGASFEVQRWFEDAWSWCTKPTQADMARVELWPDEVKRTYAGMRLEAVCRITADGVEIERGLIFSAPRL